MMVIGLFAGDKSVLQALLCSVIPCCLEGSCYVAPADTCACIAIAACPCAPHPSACRAEDGAETAELPHQKVKELTRFQQLLLVRCLQPRAFLSAALVSELRG